MAAHQGRRTLVVRRPDLRDIRGLRLSRDCALNASLSDAFTQGVRLHHRRAERMALRAASAGDRDGDGCDDLSPSKKRRLDVHLLSSSIAQPLRRPPPAPLAPSAQYSALRSLDPHPPPTPQI